MIYDKYTLSHLATEQSKKKKVYLITVEVK